MNPPQTSVYVQAPLSHRIAHWLRFFFMRRVIHATPPENMGCGLRQVVVLDCGHNFHVKPKTKPPKQMGCAACALEWVKKWG